MNGNSLVQTSRDKNRYMRETVSWEKDSVRYKRLLRFMKMDLVSPRTTAYFLQAHHRLFESNPSTIVQA